MGRPGRSSEDPEPRRRQSTREPKVKITLFGEEKLVTRDEALDWRICDGALKGDLRALRAYFKKREADRLRRAAEPRSVPAYSMECYGHLDHNLADALVKLNLAEWTSNYRGEDRKGAKYHLGLTSLAFQLAFAHHLPILTPERIKKFEEVALDAADVLTCFEAAKGTRGGGSRRVQGARGRSENVGYGRPPVTRQFQKGSSGFQGRRREPTVSPIIGDYVIPAARAGRRKGCTIDRLIRERLEQEALRDASFLALFLKEREKERSSHTEKGQDPSPFFRFKVGLDPGMELSWLGIVENVLSEERRSERHFVPKLASWCCEEALRQQPESSFTASQVKMLSLSLQDLELLDGLFEPVDLSLYDIPRHIPYPEYKEFTPYDAQNDRSPAVSRQAL